MAYCIRFWNVSTAATLQKVLSDGTTNRLVDESQVILYAAAMSALARAVEEVGGQTALARAIGGPVKQGHVWYWLNAKDGLVPAEHCLAIERATSGRITRFDLRPDIFGERSEEAA
jgi:DNA-binding transcriptional regulator YdaS (Cro superfamily)